MRIDTSSWDGRLLDEKDVERNRDKMMVNEKGEKRKKKRQTDPRT